MEITFGNFKQSVADTSRCSIRMAYVLLNRLCERFNELEDWDEENCARTYNQILQLAEIVKNAPTKNGTADDYHNLAVQYARIEHEEISCELLDMALAMPQCHNDIDLLADYLKYCISAGMLDQGEIYYKRLEELGKSRWNWRGFSFAIDYILVKYIRDEDCEKCLNALAKTFKTIAGNSIEPFISQADIYHAFNHYDEEEKELLSAMEIPLCKNARGSKVKLKLADLYFERGNIEESLKYAVMAYNSAVAAQKEINYGYAYSLAALCRISQIYNSRGDLNNLAEMVNMIRQEKRCAECAKDITGAYKELENQYEILKIRYNVGDEWED